MIHAHELMLGNWVRYKMEDDVISNPVKVELISNQCVDVTNGENSWDVNKGDLIGIPITEELLEKCGIYAWFLYYTNKEGFKIYHSSSKWYICAGDTNIYVDFLHELQNAYYLLTKKQLKVCL